MANPNVTLLQLAAASSNNIALSQTPGAAGNLTLNGAAVSSGVATLDVARRILVSTAGADSARTFTIFGTDRNGNVQQEAITGIATGTSAFTFRDFKTVTRVSVDAATAGAITVGTNSVGSSEWVFANYVINYWNLQGGCTGPAATTYSVEITFDDPAKATMAGAASNIVSPQQYSLVALGNVPPHVYTLPAFLPAGLSGDNLFMLNGPVFAFRLTILTGTGAVQMESIQAGT